MFQREIKSCAYWDYWSLNYLEPGLCIGGRWGGEQIETGIKDTALRGGVSNGSHSSSQLKGFFFTFYVFTVVKKKIDIKFSMLTISNCTFQ